MYVCLCNAFTDRQVKALAARAAGSAAAVYRCLGVRPKCGKCVPTVRQMLQALAAAPPPGTGDPVDSQASAGAAAAAPA
jgi:bacterioferritin-associated ferredoxin